MKKIFILILIAFSLQAEAQERDTIPLTVHKNHIYFYAVDTNNDCLRILVDTGAKMCVVFDKKVLINKIGYRMHLAGLNGSSKVTTIGTLKTNLFETYAYRVKENKPYDAIIGLDWMIEHEVIIDLPNKRLIYKP